MLRDEGGLAVTDDPEDMIELLKLYGVPDTPVVTKEIEYKSLFGKKRRRTVNLAFLDAKAAK